MLAISTIAFISAMSAISMDIFASSSKDLPSLIIALPSLIIGFTTGSARMR